MGQEPEAVGFRRLRVWQKADSLASAVFDAFITSEETPRWLRDQVSRSAISVPANIAEGYTRGSPGDYLRFLEIARGSLAETEYYISFVAKKKLITEQECRLLADLCTDTGRLLQPLIRAISEKKREGAWNRIKEESVLYESDPT